MRAQLPILVFAASIQALAGCAFIDDFGKFEVVERDGQVEGDGEVQGNLECVDRVLEEASAAATTSGADGRSASCGGVAAPEKIFQWTAPHTDFFRFHTNGSAFETVLSLVDDDCDGAELACNDAQEEPYKSEIIRRFEEGARVLLVVDGRSGDSGDLVVNVEPIACPGVQLTDAILPASHSTAGRDPYPGMTCTGGEHGARTYRFTAPSDGYYSFLAKRTGTGWRPSIRVEEGPICGGTALQCNGIASDAEGFPLGQDGRAEVLRRLAEGEHVTVVVSGYDGEGDFELDVTETGIASCVDETLVVSTHNSPTVLDATLPLDGPHRATSSCGQASVVGYQNAILSQPDLNVRIELPEQPGGGCYLNCSAHVQAGFRFVASVSELDATESCARRELSCVESDEINFEPPVYERWVSVPVDGAPKLLTIDRRLTPYSEGPPIYDPTLNEVDVSVTVDCALACV